MTSDRPRFPVSQGASLLPPYGGGKQRCTPGAGSSETAAGIRWEAIVALLPGVLPEQISWEAWPHMAKGRVKGPANGRPLQIPESAPATPPRRPTAPGLPAGLGAWELASTPPAGLEGDLEEHPAEPSPFGWASRPSSVRSGGIPAGFVEQSDPSNRIPRYAMNDSEHFRALALPPAELAQGVAS